LKNRKTQTLFTKPKTKKKTLFTFIDLFAGIGGTRTAFEKVGGECVFSSEWDSSCQKTYEANFGEIPAGDITGINEKEIPDFDILVAGFPCQPFSTIGKRQGFLHSTQGTLFYDVLRIIKEKRPVGFLLENVPGLTNHDSGKTFEIILGALNELNYEVRYQILNSVDFGVPQKRKRIYIVGFDKRGVRGEINFQFPKGKSKKVYIKDFLEKNAEGFGISEYLQKNYIFKKKDGKPEVVDHTSKIQVKTLVSSYHKIQRLTGTFVKDGKTGLRLFTTGECKAIMGFSPHFIVPVSRTQMYRQFGNSVVIPVVHAVAKEMIKKAIDIKLI